MKFKFPFAKENIFEDYRNFSEVWKYCIVGILLSYGLINEFINTDNKYSDIRIGEYESAGERKDNYINDKGVDMKNCKDYYKDEIMIELKDKDLTAFRK